MSDKEQLAALGAEMEERQAPLCMEKQIEQLQAQLADAKSEARKYKLAGLGMAASMGQHVCVPNGWRLATDSTPSDKEYVWCFGIGDGGNGQDVFEGYYDATCGKWWALNNGDYVDGGYGNDYPALVTHWMPLPPPPNLGGQQ